MVNIIQADKVVQQDLASRGIDAKTGVYGEHKVQLGKGLPISLDQIKTPSLPFAGFRQATKIARGKEGLSNAADDLLRALTAKGHELDVAKMLSALKAGQTHFERLDRLGQLTRAQKDDTMWMFTRAVEKLSNADLAAVYQSFTSAEMDLVQAALQREGEINPDARDARMAASRLFDLQALVLKEVSNRASQGMLEDLRANNPDDASLKNLQAPKSLSAQWGDVEGTESGAQDLRNVALNENDWQGIIRDQSPERVKPAHENDMSSANLLTLVEVSAKSSTIREKTALDQTQRLNRRNIKSVSVKEMADVMRKSELTYNLETRVLLQHIITHPNEPISNIFHLAEKGIKPKGDGYLAHRDAVEKQLFPELAGHEARGKERPIYGALNVAKDPIGAATIAYGDASIVFKPEVSKRSTFIADDTFYSPRLSITDERKDNFYKLLDGANIPQSLVTALRDKNSVEHKDLEAWLDKASRPNASIHEIDVPPKSISNHFQRVEHESYFTTLLAQCFIDKEATRTNMATYDNLESLVVNMGDIDGNSLANAARRNRQGQDGRVIMTGAQYIEAQIHGPVVPSRDIAEIRVNYASLPGNDAAKAQALQDLEAFGRQNGIKITVLRYNANDVLNGLQPFKEQQTSFNAKHVDSTTLENLTQSYSDNFEQHALDVMKGLGNLPTLPPGMLRLEGAALQKAKDRFQEVLPQYIAENRGSRELHQIFDDAMTEGLKVGGLFIKAGCLSRLITENLPFESEAQKAAFMSWVCSSTSLPNENAMLMVYKQSTAQAKLFKEMAASHPPMQPQEVFRRLAAITDETRKAINAANALDIEMAHVNEADIMQNAAFVTRSMLQSGEPPLDAEGLQQVYEALNSKELREMGVQLKQVADNPEIAKTGDGIRLSDTATAYMGITGQLAAYLNQSVAPATLQNISMMPAALRETVREVAPQAAAKMDELFPAYTSFPQPARPNDLPSTEPQRRAFLVKTLDTYEDREKNIEEFTHGRGHITRAYIYANAMCNILEEEGVQVDRNAVLCGITGHDLGREGGGEDVWEEQSARMTKDAMRTAFGQESMGEQYETQVGNCILRGKMETIEGMLLKSADSLDIGRTVDFESKYFPFLADKDPNKQDREPDKYTVSSPRVTKLREQLMEEAKILQALTDPKSRWRNASFRLMGQFYAGNEQQNEMVKEQWKELQRDILQEYHDEWKVDSENYVQQTEKIVLGNPDIFPVLSKYYRKN